VAKDNILSRVFLFDLFHCEVCDLNTWIQIQQLIECESEYGFAIPGAIAMAFNWGFTIKPISLLNLRSGLRIRIHFIRIRIQRFRLNTDPDPVRIQGFNDQKLKKIYS
jgi:hypothetical protein